MSQTEENILLWNYVLSLIWPFLEAVLILDIDIGEVNGVFELGLLVILLFFILCVEGSAHRGKTVTVDLILSYFPDVCFFLSYEECTYPVCSFGGLEIVLRGILCLTEMNCRKGLVEAYSKLREM